MTISLLSRIGNDGREDGAYVVVDIILTIPTTVRQGDRMKEHDQKIDFKPQTVFDTPLTKTIARIGISYDNTSDSQPRNLYTSVLFTDKTSANIDPLYYHASENNGMSATGLYMQTIMVNTLVAAMVAGKPVSVVVAKENNCIYEVTVPPVA